MRLVKVTWVDSYGCGSQWEELDNIKDISHKCISVGYLVGDGDKVKVIVPHISPENTELGSLLQGCGEMSIPVFAITEMVELVPVEKVGVAE